ncbi:MAG TPA: NUDIX domain-containing protein [Clostridia bacterium]|nr:NUDIX domain-containing protein [Clostridia bacterium]
MLRFLGGAWHVAVIEPETRNSDDAAKPGAKQKTIFALPKGAVDPGERPEQAAAREVFEETGVRVRRIAKLTDIKYFYQRTWGGRERVFKVVSFYLFIYRSGKLGEIAPEMRIEVRQADWLPLEDAPRKLSYKGEREVAKLALEYVRNNPDLHERALVPPAQGRSGDVAHSGNPGHRGKPGRPAGQKIRPKNDTKRG